MGPCLYGTSSKGYENDTTLQLLWLFVCHVGQNQNCHSVPLTNHTVCMVQHIPSKGISRSGWGRDWAGATPNRLLGSPSRDKGRMAQKVNAERPNEEAKWIVDKKFSSALPKANATSWQNSCCQCLVDPKAILFTWWGPWTVCNLLASKWTWIN